jgi:Glycosyltransferase sugar-binding region containing DXD motif
MIPKIIHFCWLSNDEYTKKIKKCIDSWKIKLPDYEFILWDTKKFDINSTVWTKQAFETKKYAFAADYIRLHAIYTYGGIYLDTDIEVLKKFDDLLNLPYFIGSQHDRLIEAAVIGAEKNSEWVLDCLKYYNDRSFLKNDGSFDTVILPKIMESQIRISREIKILTVEEVKHISQFCTNEMSFNIFPFEYFSAKNYESRKVKKTYNTYTIHHFEHSWLSLISKLRRKFIIVLGVSKTEQLISFLGLRKIVKSFKKWYLDY